MVPGRIFLSVYSSFNALLLSIKKFAAAAVAAAGQWDWSMTMVNRLFLCLFFYFFLLPLLRLVVGLSAMGLVAVR